MQAEDDTGTAETSAKPSEETNTNYQKAKQIAQLLDLQYKQKLASNSTGEGHFEVEIEINDYPQQARWKVCALMMSMDPTEVSWFINIGTQVTQKETIAFITELTGAAIIARGSYVPSGRKPNPGERKLYLVSEIPM